MYTTLTCVTLNCTALHCTSLHITAVQCNVVQFIPVQCRAGQCSAVPCTTVQDTLRQTAPGATTGKANSPSGVACGRAPEDMSSLELQILTYKLSVIVRKWILR